MLKKNYVKSKLPLEFFIAVRYLKSQRKVFFSLLTTLIAVGGTTLGVAALVITLSVMTGFQTSIRAKILSVQPHLFITRVDGHAFRDYERIAGIISENQNVTHVSPFIFAQTVLRNVETGGTSGALIKGVNFETENKMFGLSQRIQDVYGQGLTSLGEGEIVLGSELARSLFVMAGDEIVLMFPTEMGQMPRMQKLTVAGIMRTGMFEYDNTLTLVDIESLGNFLHFEGAVSGLGAVVANANRAQIVADELDLVLGHPYSVRSWTDMNRNLFFAFQLEKIMMFIILAIIILVAAFNIVSNLLLLSTQKAKDIGILSALGYPKAKISKIFFYEGLIVGTIGTTLGLILGLGISLFLKNFEIIQLPPGVYFVDRLPVMIVPFDLFLVAGCAFIITVASGIYPAYQVSKLDPLEAIRYG